VNEWPVLHVRISQRAEPFERLGALGISPDRAGLLRHRLRDVARDKEGARGQKEHPEHRKCFSGAHDALGVFDLVQFRMK